MEIGNGALPEWAAALLADPQTGGQLMQRGSRLVAPDDRSVAEIVGGIVRWPLDTRDQSIEFYRGVGGAKFHERSSVAFAMSTLDTPIYHGYLAELRGDALPDAVILDVGGGDGRNATPWLNWGFRRVIVLDPVYAALQRLRARIAEDHSEWLDRLLLIEGDARRIPLRTGCADRVLTIEALAYLNDDYEAGLRECKRALAPNGALLVADRDYEAGLITRLLYDGGIAGMLEQGGRNFVLDGDGTRSIRSRCFRSRELAQVIERNGLAIMAQHGVSALSLLLGYLRNTGQLNDSDEVLVPQVHALLTDLGRSGTMFRSHVVLARHA